MKTQSKQVQLDDVQRNVHQNFSVGTWLSNAHNVEQLIMWVTFYRRNLHRFAMDYLNVKLYWYQIIILYLMGRSRSISWVASRAAAKSFIIGIYACCRSILYPGSEIVITAGTRGQSKKIITNKVQGILIRQSPLLRREVDSLKDNQNEVLLTFFNRSTIKTVTCSKNARGERSTVNIGEEAREIDKDVYDTVISPFRIVRQTPYLTLPEYDGNPDLIEQPVNIFITSSFPAAHWMNKEARETAFSMLGGSESSFFMSLDYSVTLRHNLRTREQMIEDKRRFDPITFATEFENLVLTDNSKCFFTYGELNSRQVIKMPFYPARNEDVLLHKKNPYAIKKMSEEIRIVSCDIAAVDRGGNDNSAFTLLRLFPEVVTRGGGIEKSFKIQVPYIEHCRGGDARSQALRIQQLFNDFEADYIVLDTRSFGLGVYDSLARVMFDDDRNVEYGAMTSMNDPVIASRIKSNGAKECIYCVNASLKLNSDIAVCFKGFLQNNSIDFLVPLANGIDALEELVPEYLSCGPDRKLEFEAPFLETALMISETSRLTYSRKENTGLIAISERGNETKDRYSSISYGCYFASLLSKDLLVPEESFSGISCVTALDL